MYRRVALASLPLLPTFSGCAAWWTPPQTAALREQRLPNLPARHELTHAPFFPQTEHLCGPAALATALVHAGIATTPDALAPGMYLPAREGTLQVEMLAAARRRGAMAVITPPRMATLFEEVAAGQVVVVLQNLGVAIAPRWHYAVLVGYDLAAGEVVLRSGTTRRELMNFALFERSWARGEHWAFVALLPPRLPATATEAAAVEAAVAFERVAPPAAVLAAYQALTQRWPHNPLAGLGLGNAHAALAQWGPAAAAFEATARQHGRAGAWHNLGVARLQLGDKAAAREAAQQALQRAQANEPQWIERARQLLAAAS